MLFGKATAASATAATTATASASSAAPPRSAREFDAIVYGATGFTGRLVCEHLARDYSGRPSLPASARPSAAPGLPAADAAPPPPTAPKTASANAPVRWAMAGRDPAKLSALAADLATRVWGDAALASEVPLIVADAHDAPALAAMAARGKVVLSTAGPYAKYGDAVVDAAVGAGTHYADLAGEVLWARRVADRLHARAAASGTKVVCSSGYDSVPSDLGAWMAADALLRRAEEKGGGKGGKGGAGVGLVRGRATRVVTVVGAAKGGFSGGTVHSGLNMIKAEDPAEVARASKDPYYLSHGVAPFGAGSAEGRLPPRVDAPAPWGPARTPDAARAAALVAGVSASASASAPPVASPYLAPFVMAAINQKVVHKSEALWRLREAGSAGGAGSAGVSRPSPFSPRGLTYLEAMGVPSYPAAAALAGAFFGVGTLFALKPLRALAERYVLPAPGQGPSRELMVGGFWNHVTFAVADEDEEGGGEGAGAGGAAAGAGARKASAPAMAVAVLADSRDPGYFGTARMLLETGLCMALDETACAEAGALAGGCLTATTATGGAPLVRRLRAAGLRAEVVAVSGEGAE